MMSHRIVRRACPCVAAGVLACLQGCFQSGATGDASGPNLFGTDVTYQVLGPITPIHSTSAITAGFGQSLVIRGGQTAKVPVGDSDTPTKQAFDDWEVQLFSGHGAVTLMGESGCCIDLTRGQLYVLSKYHEEPIQGGAPAASMVAGPVPVVVRKNSVQAGSFGTHWFVWVDDSFGNSTMYFVLLANPAGGSPGELKITQTNSDGTKYEACLTAADTYVELSNYMLQQEEPLKPLGEAGKALKDAVAAAKLRAAWKAGPRTP